MPAWLVTLFQWTGAAVISALVGFALLKLAWVTGQAAHYMWFIRQTQQGVASPEAGLQVFALKWLEVLMFGVAPEPTAAGLWQGWSLRRRRTAEENPPQ